MGDGAGELVGDNSGVGWLVTVWAMVQVCWSATVRVSSWATV